MVSLSVLTECLKMSGRIGHRLLYTMLNDGQESTEEDQRAKSSIGKGRRQNKRDEHMALLGKIPSESSRYDSFDTGEIDQQGEIGLL